ncbi:MAG: hypothetical protein ABI476_06040 [Oxalobacteraceae bacterium]
MNTHKLIAAGAVLLSTLLAGCGGGSSSPAKVTVSDAQGVYEGTVSNGREHRTLILENNQFFTIYGNTGNGGFGIAGFIQGNGKTNSGNFSSTDLKDFFADGTVVSGSLSASYIPKTSFNGTLTEGTSTVTFTGAPLKSSSYNYDTAANPANIAGAWILADLQGSTVAVSISSSGALVGSTAGCAFNGTINPRASGKNVFDVALTFGAISCRLTGQTATGIAIEYPLANGKRQLIIAGTDKARANGTAFFGVR